MSNKHPNKKLRRTEKLQRLEEMGIIEATSKKPKKFNWKLLGLLAISFIVIFGVYRIFIALEVTAIMWIYLILTCVIAVSFYVVNGGITSKPAQLDMLPDDWDIDKKKEFIEQDTERKKRAKYILILLLPFLFTFFFDMIELFYIDYFKAIFKDK